MFFKSKQVYVNLINNNMSDCEGYETLSAAEQLEVIENINQSFQYAVYVFASL
jgi:hypothetical protein